MSQHKLMNKSAGFAICASLRNKIPNCPYLGLPCQNFFVNLASGVCCEGKSRCSWLPSWIASVSFGYAVLMKDGRLHV